MLVSKSIVSKSMFIRFFGFLIASALLLANLSALADLRPNMIFILMDDFGYNDLGVQTYPTPENYYPDA